MRLSIILGLVLIFRLLFGQQLVLVNEPSTCKVLGTSTLHDWHLDAAELSGNANLELENGELVGISELTFSVEVEQLMSGKRAMDKNTFKALSSTRYPEIMYQFVRTISSEKSGEGLLLKTGGKLTISGTTKSIYLDVLVTVEDGVWFKGSTTFMMSDYGISPPIALMGAVKTGDEITVEFNVKYN